MTRGTIQYPPAAHDMQTEGDPAEWFRRNCVLVEKPRWDAVSHANTVQAKELGELRARLAEAELLLQSVCDCAKPCDKCQERVEMFIDGETVFAPPSTVSGTTPQVE
jgi:hypothetical protein